MSLIPTRIEIPEPNLFSHTARDGVAMFYILFIVFFPGGVMLGPPFISVDAFIFATVGFIVVALGLDCKIVVGPTEVRFMRRIFWIPYYVVRGKEITSVVYDSDWDDEETASGVVVTLAGKEVHIGAGKRKNELYMNLYRCSAEHRVFHSDREL